MAKPQRRQSQATVKYYFRRKANRLIHKQTATFPPLIEDDGNGTFEDFTQIALFSRVIRLFFGREKSRTKMEPFSSVSNLIEEARLEEPTILNLVSAIFNLMNAVIGAGIIGEKKILKNF